MVLNSTVKNNIINSPGLWPRACRILFNTEWSLIFDTLSLPRGHWFRNSAHQSPSPRGSISPRSMTACVLQWILNIDASKSSRPPHSNKVGSATGDTGQRVARSRAPSESGGCIQDYGPHVRNLMNVLRILLLAFSVLARLSF